MSAPRHLADLSRRHSQAPLVVAALACALASTGCAGWLRGNGGYAYSLAGKVPKSGPMVGVDTILTPKPHSVLNHSAKKLPIGLHTGLEGIFAPDLKSFGWTSGVAYFSTPRPVGGYVIAGTNGHFDVVNGKASFGNFQPYAELGLATPLVDRDEEQDGPLFTLGLEYMLLVHYLAPASDRVDNMLIMKFGFGWETH